MTKKKTRIDDPIRITSSEDLFDTPREIDSFARNARPHIRRGLLVGIDLGISQTGSSFNPDDLLDLAEARQILDELALDHSINTLKSTKKSLQKLIDEALRTGQSNFELAEAIAAKYGDEFRGHRALRIARTESTAAINAGIEEVYKQEKVEYKVWVAILDIRTRDAHNAMDVHTHESPVKVDDYFDFARVGYEGIGKYPADPLLPPEQRINCRCTTISSEFTDLFRDGEYGRLFIRQHGSIEKPFVVSLRRAFNTQKKRVIKRLLNPPESP